MKRLSCKLGMHHWLEDAIVVFRAGHPYRQYVRYVCKFCDAEKFERFFSPVYRSWK